MSCETYPYLVTTLRYGIDDNKLLLLLHQLSTGYQPEHMPRNLRVYKVEYILLMDDLRCRRFAKGLAVAYLQGLHVVILAQHQSDLDQISDNYLRCWMRTNCLRLNNPELFP